MLILSCSKCCRRTEGIFTEPAGGVAVAVLRQMVDEGLVDRSDTTVCYVTGNGLKAVDPLMGVLPRPEVVKADADRILAEVR